ncbi:5'-AMP-activated protein kinase subunit beta-2 [Planoprotostelium fungivorum]|uniref:5'-AMP-activated protein kinase subunit beta-2 n=1 Tax=Planoprotostelium fungivorum TaxID=1890364 RepID=A0A2P6NNF5_9EUKA|nr:5'-AMP-activated protein kinase subunit beta-2 [Planoprotostelium fungivorum]
MGISSSTEEKKVAPPNKPLNGSGGVNIRSGGARFSSDEEPSPLYVGSPTKGPLPLASPMKIQISESVFPSQSKARRAIGAEEWEGRIDEDNKLPTVFSWKHGGQSIYLSGTFNNWRERIPMQESHGDFTVIQSLPPGIHYYRFIVDGKWQTDPGQPVITDADGEVNNIIEIKSMRGEENSILSGPSTNSPPGTYGQEIRLPSPPKSRNNSANNNASSTTSTSPPSLPPHLMRALLNTAPPSKFDPSLLPLPHHVMLNHFYSLPRPDDDIIILGVTQRYKTKFVTTVFYKPLPILDGDTESSSSTDEEG